jgi:S1-C subfamily serine protease
MNESGSHAKYRMLAAAMDERRDELLALPGVTGVAIGRKEVHGESTGELAVIVFVERKLPEREITRNTVRLRLPQDVPTDVVEREFDIVELATNPLQRYEPMYCGLSISTVAVPTSYGSIGCFIRTDGNANVPAGTYLLTNEHVIGNASPNGVILQPVPANPGNIPNDTRCGNYVYGVKDDTHDCAVSSIGFSRTVANDVQIGTGTALTRLVGLGEPDIQQQLYKFGARTNYTTGIVKYINFTIGTAKDLVYVESGAVTQAWLGAGDSGSVAILQNEHIVVALNWGGDNKAKVTGSNDLFWGGVAYPIYHQLSAFGTRVALA